MCRHREEIATCEDHLRPPEAAPSQELVSRSRPLGPRGISSCFQPPGPWKCFGHPRTPHGPKCMGFLFYRTASLWELPRLSSWGIHPFLVSSTPSRTATLSKQGLSQAQSVMHKHFIPDALPVGQPPPPQTRAPPLTAPRAAPPAPARCPRSAAPRTPR